MRVRLDATDWRILKELQSNGRISNVELAEKIGLSPPPCLRRVRALEQSGLIAGYYAALDERQMGFDVIGFAMVGLHQSLRVAREKGARWQQRLPSLAGMVWRFGRYLAVRRVRQL